MRTWDYWVEAGSEGPVDLEHYQATGGMAEALSRHADEVFESLPDEEHRRIATKLFKSLTEKVSENRGIRRPMQLNELHEICGGEMDHLLHVIHEFRKTGCTFLMPAGESELQKHTIIDISHESLMRVWRTLRLWVDDEAQSAKIYRRLADTASLFKDGKAGLYRDPDLGIALAWRDANQPNQTWADRYYPGFAEAMAFLDKSQAEEEREAKEKEEARKRELAQAQALAKAKARTARIFKAACVGVTLLAVLALYSMFEAQKSRDIADAQILKLAARSIHSGGLHEKRKDYLGALVYYADGIQLAKKDKSTQNSYLKKFQNTLRDVVKINSINKFNDEIKVAFYGPNEQSIYIASSGNSPGSPTNVSKLDLTNGVVTQIVELNHALNALIHSSDKKCIVGLDGPNRTYCLINLGIDPKIFTLQSTYSHPRPPLFSHTGKYAIFAGSMENRETGITVVNTETFAVESSTVIKGGLTSISSSRDDEVIFSTSSSGYNLSSQNKINYLWDFKESAPKIMSSKLLGATSWIRGAKKMPSGEGTLLHTSTDSDDGEQSNQIVFLKNDQSNFTFQSLKTREQIKTFAVSKNAKYLAIAKANGFTEAYNLYTNEKIWEHDSAILGTGNDDLRFSPDSEALIIFGADSNLSLLESRSGQPITSNMDQMTDITSGQWNSTGHQFLITTRSGTLLTYNLANPDSSTNVLSKKILPESTHQIAEALALRRLIDGDLQAIEPDLESHTNFTQEFNQFKTKNDLKKWHSDTARKHATFNAWSSVDFHLSKAQGAGNLTLRDSYIYEVAKLNLGNYKPVLHKLTERESNEIFDMSHWDNMEWRYSGYFDCKNDLDGFNTESLEISKMLLRKDRKWKTLTQDNILNSEPFYGATKYTIKAPPNTYYYVSKNLKIEKSGFYDLFYHSDDQMIAWINGIPTYSFFSLQGRSSQSGSADKKTTYFEKGNHTITLKIVNGVGPTGFGFSIGDRIEDPFNNLTSYSRLITGEGINDINIRSDFSENEILNYMENARLYTDNPTALNKLYQAAEKTKIIQSSSNRTKEKDASFIIPKHAPTEQQLQKGFTLECFINTQRKQGVNHIISNGGSFTESGFSLLTTGMNSGILRGEFQNRKTGEKILLDAPYPFDDRWHHVALTYNSNTKTTALFLDGERATRDTPFKSLLEFNPEHLTIGDNYLRGMGFKGFISDIRVIVKPLTDIQIAQLPSENHTHLDIQEIFELKLRSQNKNDLADEVLSDSLRYNNLGFSTTSAPHPRSGDVSGSFFCYFNNPNSNTHSSLGALGILEYTLGEFEKGFEHLIRANNNGRFSTEVTLYPNFLPTLGGMYLAMSYYRNGMTEKASVLRDHFNQRLSGLTLLTRETTDETDILTRIHLKTIQNEMNALIINRE